MSVPDVPDLLAAAVESLGGARRDGQLAMAEAVGAAIDDDHHLAVQAGTGTGKSLAYLVPALRHAVDTSETVVVSTATIALQRQLTERDLPRLSAALTEPLGREPSFAILKGRANYLCLNRIHSGMADEEPNAELFDAFDLSRMGREVTRLREWTSATETGDRDDLSPGVSDQSWRQVSVSSRECLGAANCAYGEDCFAELARKKAGAADVVVTNHAMLAIDAMSPATILPEHRVVVIDEAHELVDRITSVTTEEISAAGVAQVARRLGKLIDDDTADALAGAGEQLELLLEDCPEGEWTRLPTGAPEILASLRDRLWNARNAVGPAPSAGSDPESAAARQMALSATDSLHDSVVRVLTVFGEADITKRHDVVWLSADRFRTTVRRVLRIAPLSVAGLLRTSLFTDSTVILTSATLTIGGNFDALARTWGLPPHGSGDDVEGSGWRGLDAGSPFDYPRAAILYVGRHLRAPGRDGIDPGTLDEMVDLMNAAGGRTLGLFSSMRAAKEATEKLRDRVGFPILCQGEDATSALIEKFAADESTCLFGTLSLWQGVDVPGPSLRLVMIDRIPFPRPDDPLLSARQRDVDARGGNGFLTVSANHAALLLAQGAGRLLRATADRGVVAVLDSRLATARYGGYLLAGLPPFWRTTDPKAVRAALSRLTTGAAKP
ncbi:MAG: ATP-dependent DNA helicase [Gordonia sp. (in: high G+C Gram-positive bacteria)]|uniref:ATP-dependent DNA helicase n=1 Tax=Gordonia sp. (in: high G+C Gram-positive bacteria) TaxID=84139 RepID=UPI003C78D878